MAMDDEQKLTKDYFMQLHQPENKVQCMHVWIDGTLRNFRTKDKTMPDEPISVEELPAMEFCGSATDFDVGNLADYYAKPVKFYRDPFRGDKNTIALCETYSRDGLPTFANNRYRLQAARQKHPRRTDGFTFLQSYTLLQRDGHPLTYMDPAYSSDSKSGFVSGREIAEAHYRACLYSGVSIASYEPISNHGQWLFSVDGKGGSVDVADDSWMSRFLLVRVAEDFGVVACFENHLRYSCLAPTYAELRVDARTMTGKQKERLELDLLSQLVIKEGKKVKVTSRGDHIQVTNIVPEVDPYALLTKVSELI